MNSPFDYIHAWSELARLERVDFVINYITNTAKLYIVTLHNVLPKNLPKIIHPQLQRLKILILKLLKFMSKFTLTFLQGKSLLRKFSKFAQNILLQFLSHECSGIFLQ
jgi:hypothetical protein